MTFIIFCSKHQTETIIFETILERNSSACGGNSSSFGPSHKVLDSIWRKLGFDKVAQAREKFFESIRNLVHSAVHDISYAISDLLAATWLETRDHVVENSRSRGRVFAITWQR